MSEVCTIKITMDRWGRGEFGFEPEDIVKNAWGHMIPWFTARHGVRSGHIELEEGAVRIEWKYDEVACDSGSDRNGEDSEAG